MSLVVAQLTLGLDEIAVEIHRVWDETKVHQVAAWEGYFRTGALLIEARRRFGWDRAYGQWFAAQGFEFSSQWGRRLMRATEREDEVRVLLDTAVSSNPPGVNAVLDMLRDGADDDFARAVLSAEDEAIVARVRAGETVVVNLHRHQAVVDVLDAEGLYVRIDRRTDWGNPFEMPDDGDRDTVVDRFAEHYVPFKPSLLARLPELRGALGCWCAPERCHGDVLLAKVRDGNTR